MFVKCSMFFCLVHLDRRKHRCTQKSAYYWAGMWQSFHPGPSSVSAWASHWNSCLVASSRNCFFFGVFSKYTVNSFRAGLLVEEVESPTVRHNILRFDTLILVCVWAESWNFLPPSNSCIVFVPCCLFVGHVFSYLPFTIACAIGLVLFMCGFCSLGPAHQGPCQIYFMVKPCRQTTPSNLVGLGSR